MDILGSKWRAYIPELLYPNVKEIEDHYIQIIASKALRTRI